MLKFHEKLTSLRRENYQLKKQVFLQKRKFFLLADAVEKTMKSVEEVQGDLRMSEKGELYLAKMQLEMTIKNLTEEIEQLSERNHQLVQNLHTQNFFDKYQETLQELNQLKLEQEALIDYKMVEQRQTNSKLYVLSIRYSETEEYLYYRCGS